MNRIVPLVLAIVCLLGGSLAHADNVGREAGKHFQRGVDLYNDGDFRGALVEFRRAYAMLPRASVLYDIGETEFQLQEYAAALVTMRRFLAETGGSAPHRAEVEATVETLRNRVGKIALESDTVHCDVLVDEQLAGVTPLVEPILASVGPRKVALACADRPIATRRVDVVAGELVHVSVQLGPSLTPTTRVQVPRVSVESMRHRRQAVLALTWTATALLAATAIGVGSATLVESSQLGDLRGTYPVQRASLDDKAGLTRNLSIAADTIGVAALVAIGVSTYVTIKGHKEKKTVLGFGVGLGTATVRGTF